MSQAESMKLPCLTSESSCIPIETVVVLPAIDDSLSDLFNPIVEELQVFRSFDIDLAFQVLESLHGEDFEQSLLF